MQIEFRTRKLQKQYEDHRAAEKAYGKNVARRYIQRVNIIQESKNFNELQSLPGLQCHPLKGDRKGQWAIKLTGYYRMIITLKEERLQIVCIEEVSKHYGD